MAATADMPYLDPHNMTQLQSLVTLVGGKPFHEFTVPEQRDLFSKVQRPQPENPGVAISHQMINTSHGEVKTYLYMPKGVTEPVPLVYFVHGGGWIYGDAGAFAAFLIELADKSKLAVVVPEYTLAPERKFPAQQEQCLEVLQDVLKVGPGHGLITDRVVVAGDSSGGQIIAAMCILNKQRSLGLPIVHQVLLHPWIDVTAELRSGMMRDPQWSEQQQAAYFSSTEERSTILAAPGRMTAEQAKEYMPPTTLMVADQDPFKEQDEAFARLLQNAGVECGVLEAFGSLHDVEIFREARESPTSKLVMFAVCGLMRDVLSR